MPTITLINEGVMICRFTGIYGRIARHETHRAYELIEETLSIMRNAEENQMSQGVTQYCYHTLHWLLAAIQYRQYPQALYHLSHLAFTNALLVMQ